MYTVEHPNKGHFEDNIIMVCNINSAVLFLVVAYMVLFSEVTMGMVFSGYRTTIGRVPYREI